MEGPAPILALIQRVRARRRRLTVLQEVLRTGLLVAAVLATALLAASWTGRWPVVLGAVALAAGVLVVGALVRGARAVGPPPTDARVARFIEEADSSLDDRLVSAVDLLSSTPDGRPGLAGPLLADAARRADTVDPAAVVPGVRLRRAAVLAAGVLVLIGSIAFFGRGVLRESRDAITLALFPSRVTIEVLPGDMRVRAGDPLTIQARLVGNTAPVVVRLLRAPAGAVGDAASSGGWDSIEMMRAGDGYSTGFDGVVEPFRYRVVAGDASSPIFAVAVTRPPRVRRIDIDYTYPRNLGLEPRTDEDGGDIYAPAGTTVRLRVTVDGDAGGGRLALDDGTAIDLEALDAALAGSFTVARDGTYKVALVDTEGSEHVASAEYFIRMLNDRPPDVRVLRPARDREVTPLEEVEIQAEATDDFGIERLDLVYAVGGGPEQVVPLDVPRRARSVTASHLLYLEDLEVRPGDFVSYFVRARDVGRTSRGAEARSDIFFLEIRPFEQQFRMADSQASGSSGRNQSLDNLVAAQKEIIVATWKLDRRAAAAGDEAPEGDVLAVARAEAEVKERAEQTASSLRTTSLRDPRLPGAPARPGQALPGEAALTAAVDALARAVGALESLNTADALPAEMEALDRLLDAQAEVQERQVARQRAGTGGSNRASQDLSGLFDRELQREQQTNYENRQSASSEEPNEEDVLDRVRDLAERQDELLREQRELDGMGAELTVAERQRALERLTREQNELRERVEQLARQLGQTGPDQGQPGQTGQPGQRGQARTPGERMRAAAESMRDAADGMGREDAASAAEQAARALNELRQAERELRASTPEGQQRALAGLQFEARDLAEAQRALSRSGRENSPDGGQTASGDTAQGRDTASSRGGVAGRTGRSGGTGGSRSGEQLGADEARRMAGEQERLAERLSNLQRQLQQQASTGSQAQGAEDMRTAARDAAGEISRQLLVERMQENADQLRKGAQTNGGAAAGAASATSQRSADDIARSLDTLADRLAAASGSIDAESRRLSSQVARAQELREQLAETTRELERLDRDARQSDGSGGTQAGAARQEVERQLDAARALLEELQRESPGAVPNGLGFTFEGQGMVRSAPGTEAFKQDLSRWEELRMQITQVLDRAESSIAARLRARQSQDRLASGLDDRAPAEYQQHVDSYFRALADRSAR
jgi:hypothetical protein